MTSTGLSTPPPTLAALYAEIARLEAELDAACHDPVWNILTRNGVDRRLATTQAGYDVIYADVDYLHERNSTLGDDDVDVRMRQVFHERAGDLVLAGRWKRGDEVVLLVPAGTGLGAARRMLRALRAMDLSATFAIVPAATVYAAAISAAQLRVRAAKRSGRRAHIYWAGDVA